jgi:hypothetical protein
MKYLSFDCAFKTFAYTIIEINPLHASLLPIIHASLRDDAKLLNDNINESIKLLKADVIDLTEGLKEYTKHTSMRLTKTFYGEMKKIIDFIGRMPDVVIIEYQPGINDKSNVIMEKLKSYFHEMPDGNVYIINARFKNTIYLHDRYALSNIKSCECSRKVKIICECDACLCKDFQSMVGNTKCYCKKWRNNKKIKAHAVMNMLYYCKVFNAFHIISHLEYELLEHIADAFMQLLYIVVLHKKLREPTVIEDDK